MFVDRVKIHAQAGEGGAGCVSFRREKFVPKGGPDGGDGGRGGSIVLQADEHTDNLVDYHYKPIVRARRGANGQGSQKQGKSGKDVVLKVPLGTLVYRLPDGFARRPKPVDEDLFEENEGGDADFAKPQWKEMMSSLLPIADLNEPGVEFVLCSGGRGGRGNMHFKSSTNRAPRQSTPGEDGEKGEFLLELRTIADAGLVGYPNAGKSSLLAALSAARPKIAAYPFTTLRPNVGVVELGAYRRVTVADIPGLIEGAHDNVGLGHEFLRHIVRCKVLVYTIDMAGWEGREPWNDFASLRRELDLYDPTLGARPAIVIANKMDLDGAKEKLVVFRRKFRKLEVIPVSALTGENMDTVRRAIGERAASAAAVLESAAGAP